MAASDIEISQLPAAANFTTSSLVPIAAPALSGYDTKHVSGAQIADGVLDDFNYNELLTSAKSIIGAINELAGIGGRSLAVTGTLTAGNTTITLSDAAITPDSWIQIYTDANIDYINAVTTNGSITISFEAQAADVEVGVEIRPVIIEV